MLHGKHDEARASLARLRVRTLEEAEGDLLLQVSTSLPMVTWS